jgi:annexin A7/11
MIIFVFVYQIDLAQVKQRYQQLYNRSLAQDVSGDTSGDYKRILLSIVK